MSLNPLNRNSLVYNLKLISGYTQLIASCGSRTSRDVRLQQVQAPYCGGHTLPSSFYLFTHFSPTSQSSLLPLHATELPVSRTSEQLNPMQANHPVEPVGVVVLGTSGSPAATLSSGQSGPPEVNAPEARPSQALPHEDPLPPT